MKKLKRTTTKLTIKRSVVLSMILISLASPALLPSTFNLRLFLHINTDLLEGSKVRNHGFLDTGQLELELALTDIVISTTAAACTIHLSRMRRINTSCVMTFGPSRQKPRGLNLNLDLEEQETGVKRLKHAYSLHASYPSSPQKNRLF